MASVLIVEDDANSAEMLAEMCQLHGYTCTVASDLADAGQQMLVHEPDVVLLDLHLPDGLGLTLFEDESRRKNAEIILMTGQASVDTSVKALRLGAADYLVKPIGSTMLKRSLARAIAKPPAVTLPIHSGEADAAGGDAAANGEDAGFCGLIGKSALMQSLYEQISRVARTSVSVLIVGESGTGKELIAQAVHQVSRRADGPFRAINCGAISEQLIESELFGHEKGSFTGAIKAHQGIFEQADGGTLFLDEVTEMPIELQVRLLRVLETGTYSRVGSTTVNATDVRVIAATNRDPMQAISDGRLREDLYYRLNVFRLEVPPLRERKEDINALARQFLDSHNQSEGTTLHFSDKALLQLGTYNWPGNVRELRNVVARAAIMAESDEVQRIDIDANGACTAPLGTPPSKTAETAGAGKDSQAYVQIPIGTSVADAERLLIEATLAANDGAREPTAQMLGISMKTLYNRLRNYQDDGEEAADSTC